MCSIEITAQSRSALSTPSMDRVIPQINRVFEISSSKSPTTFVLRRHGRHTKQLPDLARSTKTRPWSLGVSGRQSKLYSSGQNKVNVCPACNDRAAVITFSFRAGIHVLYVLEMFPNCSIY